MLRIEKFRNCICGPRFQSQEVHDKYINIFFSCDFISNNSNISFSQIVINFNYDRVVRVVILINL